ncbi:MAG: glutamine-hydrolyzing carbamoyl-phosphate synthase small subunit [Alkalispirochaetaceae bacterium]
MKRVYLILQDGTEFAGEGFGASAPKPQELSALNGGVRCVGEVVFNTAMSGYAEVLTDPSYTGQLVAMTYPHIGNYGIDAEWSEIAPEQGVSRPKIKAAGFIVRSLYRGPVPAGRTTLHEFLSSHDIPGISDIDTRGLTLHLRDNGAQTGVIVSPDSGNALSDEGRRAVREFLAAFPSMEGRSLVGEVGTLEPVRINSGAGGPHIALYDCGAKANIIRELTAAGADVTLFQSRATAAELLSVHPDAVLLSNGPGDPAVLPEQVKAAKELIGEVPLFGICLGHQILGEALGGETYKMKFGHHGVNHPVRDERTKKVFVTSQNHGFAVREESLPKGTEVWFRNANDQTIEGLRNDRVKVLTTQFHPESAPGPRDSRWIFKAFLEAI